jgi:hypothetical protein
MNNTLLQKYLREVVYPGVSSTDLTSNVSRRLIGLAPTYQEMTARLKAMIVAAGGTN